MINIGQRVEFKPLGGIKLSDFVDEEPVEGVVVLINKQHQWFMAEYGTGKKLRTCFKFSDLGKRVKTIN